MPRNGGGVENTPFSKPQSPLRITHDGEFFARLLTKESSQGNPSFRYYGAGSGAVPFVWESQPGTPKDAYSSRMMAAAAAAAGAGGVAPAITPPPSYHLRSAAVGPHGHSSRRHGKAGRGGGRVKYYGCKLNKWIKIGFIATVFRRLAFGKSRASSAASVQPSSSSTRWLFSAGSSGAGEARDQEYCYDPPAPAKRAVLCLRVRPSPWLVQFCSGDRREPGWVYGWRQ